MWASGTRRRGLVLRVAATAAVLGVSAGCSSLGDIPGSQQAEAIDSLLREREFNGSVLVAHRGNVLLDKGYGWSNPSTKTRNTPGTVFAIGSITKTFTAAAVMRLASDGTIDLDRSIAEYVPEFSFDPWIQITSRQLLSHTSGLWRETGVGEQVTPLTEVAQRNRGIPLQCEPGTCFNYSNMGYEVLRVVLERVTGSSFESYLERTFFTPLELRSTGATVGPLVVRSEAIGGEKVNGVLSPTATAGEAAASVAVGAGGVYSTTGDLYDWVEALRAGRVLPRSVFREMVRVHSPDGLGPHDRYGYGWVVVESGSAYWHTGGIFMAFASVAFVDDRHDIVVVALSNDYSTASMFHEMLFEMERDARDRARGFGWGLPLAASTALLVSLALVFRLARDLRRRRRAWALPTLGRLLVLVAVPAGIGYEAWQRHVPGLQGIGPRRIAFTIAPLLPWRWLAFTALLMLLAACAAHAFAPSRPVANS